MSNDLLWLILSYVAVGLIIAVATWAGTGGGRSPEITRKIVHIGVGTWIIPTTLFFDSPWMAIIPPASFVLINLLSYRFKLVKAMEAGDRNPGTIYFPLAFVILILVFWPGGLFVRGLLTSGGPEWMPRLTTAVPDPVDGVPMRFFDLPARLPAMAGILVLAWADAAAAIIGRAVGRRRFTVLGATRSIEGSLAFVGFGAVAIAVSVALVGPAGWTSADGPRNPVALAGALLGGIPGGLLAVLPAAAGEAVTPGGLDNLVVPALVAITLSLSFWL